MGMVVVEWHDAMTCYNRLTEEESLKQTMPLYKTLGFLISRDPTTTIVAYEKNDQGEYRDVALIPSGCILSIRELALGSAV